MSTPIEIKDGSGSSKSVHLHQKNGDVGIIAYTSQLKEREIKFLPAFNSDYGIEMAINGEFSGTAEDIHDGTDSVLWTGSNIIGNKVTFDSTTRFNGGSKSVEINNAAVNDIWQFDKGSDIAISGYVSTTMSINVDKDWTTSDSVGVYFWDTDSNSQVGDMVLLENYFNEAEFDVWANIAIPLDDMGLGGSGIADTVDAIRFEQLAKTGKAPLFYLDDIALQEAGTPITFKVEPPAGTKYLVSRFNYTIIGTYDGRLADASMPNLSYNKFLSLSELSNGVNFTLMKNGVVIFSAPIKSISDAFKGGANIINYISDGTNTSITISTDFAEPTALDSRDGDFISVTVSDDLSSLISFTAIALGKTEEVDSL